MKFLIFNLAVGLALFYLVTADRSEFQAAAGRVHDAAGEIKSIAKEAVDEGRRMLDRKISRAEPAPPPAPVQQTAPRPPPEPAPPEALPQAEAVPHAVAKRRDEILNGLAPLPPGLALKEGERMMTPEQRRKELFSLAEEMELLYARSVSR